MRRMHQVGGANPPALTFLSLWCSSANMPASHAGDHRSEVGQGRHFLRRVVNGEEQTHLTQNQAALDVQFVSCRPISKCPQNIVSDALARYASLSPVQFRVGAPPSQSSQRSGGFHKPAVPSAALGTAITPRFLATAFR